MITCVAVVAAAALWGLNQRDSDAPRVNPDKAATKAPDAAPASDHEVQHESGHYIEGRVVNNLGEPVPRFTVEARPSHVADNEDTEIGVYTNGTFRIGPLAGGDWTLIVKGSDGTASKPISLRLPLVNESELVITVPSVVSLSGVVLAPNRVPLAGAGIYVVYADDGPVDRWPKIHSKYPTTPDTRSGPDGRFVIRDLQTGTPLVFAAAAGYCESKVVRVAIQSGGAEVALTLRDGGRVTGHIDPAVGDISHRKIGLYSHNGSIGWRDTETDASGRFDIEHVIPQAYVIDLNDGWRGMSYRKPVVVEEGATSRVIFGGRGRPIRLHGFVRAGGRPIEGVSVSPNLIGSGSGVHQTQPTDKNGAYELLVPEPGAYRFTIDAGDGSYVMVDRDVADTDEVELSFDVGSASISGTVTLTDGQPLASILVTLQRSPNANDASGFWKPYWEVRSKSDGRFEFRLLLPGQYTLRAPDGSWLYRHRWEPKGSRYGRAIKADIRVGDVPVTGIALRLSLGGRIAGRVVDPRGIPVGDAWVRVEDQSGLQLAAFWDTRTDGKGRFDIPSVPPGEYSVFARYGTRRGRSIAVSVVAEQTSETQVTLR